MTDKKKPEEFDPDKTIVDVRPSRGKEPDPDATGAHDRPSQAPPPADDEGDRTMVMPRSSKGEAPPADDDRTVMVSRPSAGGAAAGAGDQTVMTARPGPATVADAAFLLVSLSGPSRGQRFPLAGGELLVGSNPSCQIRLAGTEGVHARLKAQGESWELTNLGSPGSVVGQGGKTSTRLTLASGELVRIGDEVLRFVRAGEVFSAEFSESELEASGLARLLNPSILREKPLYGVIAALGVVVLALLLWPASTPPPATEPKGSESVPAESERANEVKALLTAGQLLFNQGRYVAPPDRPDEDSAYTRFNEVLALDPGNGEAREWLAKIDEKLGEVRRAREEAERRRREAEEAALAAKRREFEQKILVILAEGDALFEAGKVAEPAGNNALAKYHQALGLDPEYRETQDRIRRAVFFYVEKGDQFRDRGDRWRALEQYRKANRAAKAEIEEIVARVNETEAALRSGMASTENYLVMYKDDRGQLFVLDEMEKVPARYRDRAVEVKPQPKQAGP